MKIPLTTRMISLVLFVALFLIQSESPVSACAACWGDTSGNRSSVAATWGIFAMVVLMFSMLGALGGFIYYLNWRGKNPLPDYSELLQETSKNI